MTGLCFFYVDRKFGVKARLAGALPITFGLVRSNTANFDVLQPTLQVLKIYAANCKGMPAAVSTHLTVSGLGLRLRLGSGFGFCALGWVWV